MAFARDVAGHLEPVGQAHASDLAQGRIRLLRRRRVDARADPALLRALLHRRDLVARNHRRTRIADQLINRRHPAKPRQTKQTPSPDATDAARRCFSTLWCRALSQRRRATNTLNGLRLGGLLPPARGGAEYRNP